MLLRMYTLERGDPHPDPGEADLHLDPHPHLARAARGKRRGTPPLGLQILTLYTEEIKLT